MKKSALLRSLVALTSSAVLLAGCGGGGGGGTNTATAPAPATIRPTTALGNSYQYEGAVAGCSLDTQKKFVRSYLDEVYLWYNEIPEVDPAKYTNIPDYFNALLVRTPDANGLPKDRFSTVLPASQAQALQQSLGAQQQDLGSLLKAGQVPITKVVQSPGGRRVGYIQFNDHSTGAQDELINAFRQLQAGQVQDLVLDLRFNSGGFLYIAQTAASMITGPQSEGKVFEQLRYNDKRQAETASSTLLFSSKVQFQESSQYPVGYQLPQLSLPRVFILTSGRTCSASESIINSLRGIDVQVVRVGTTTCGKPYGFHQKNNCGYAYFPIEFQGTNAKGFGDYTTGFRANCEIADNTGVLAGSAADPLLNGALYYTDNNACPAGTVSGVQSAGTPIVSGEQPTRPSWAGRMLLPGQQQR
jgi:hypothetical protein